MRAPTTPGRGRLGLLLACLVLAALLGAVTVAWAPWGRSSQGVPSSVTSPPGTSLPDGLSVPAGTRLVGTPLQDRTDDGDRSTWRAVLVVDGDDPLPTWRTLVSQLTEAGGRPSAAPEADDAVGCSDEDGLTCRVEVNATGPDDPALVLGASVERVTGDVTGRWSIVLTGDRGLAPVDATVGVWPGGPVPDPPRPRSRPDVGEPLATETLGYDGDEDRYVVLAGSEVLVQYSRGSATGGFGVLLRVAPDASATEVAAGYARQSAQFEGPTETSTTQNATSTVTRFVPPGGAGGYQATVHAVDNATGADFVYYELLND